MQEQDITELAKRVLRHAELTKERPNALPEMSDKEILDWLQSHKVKPDYFPADENTDEFYLIRVSLGDGDCRNYRGPTVQNVVRKAYYDEHFVVYPQHAAPKLAQAVLDLQAERKKWGYQVRLWQKLYYPLYGTLRGALDFVDMPEHHQHLKSFINSAVAEMEVVGSGSGPDFNPQEVYEDELAKALEEIAALRPDALAWRERERAYQEQLAELKLRMQQGTGNPGDYKQARGALVETGKPVESKAPSEQGGEG